MIRSSDLSRRARQRRARAARGREGIVIIIVMIVIVVSTATAAISVRGTQAELYSAGQERLLRQTRAGAEAAMTTTVAWVDLTGGSSQLLEVLQQYQSAARAPQMAIFGGPEVVPAARRTDGRLRASQQRGLSTVSTAAANPNTEVPPIGPLNASDLSGTFGAGQAYGLPEGEAYAVDMHCFKAPSSTTAGTALSTGSGSVEAVQFACELTAHFSLQLAGSTDTVAWTLGSNTYPQPRFAKLSDSRATLITPSMLMTKD